MNKLHFRMILVLLLPFIVLLGWTCWLAYETTTRFEVTLPITGYDPRDLLSGHYILYKIDWEKVDCSIFKEKVCPMTTFITSNRYYVSQEDAPVLEKLLTDKQKHAFEITFAYKKDEKPLAKQLLVDGIDWHDFLTTKKGK